MSNVTNSGGAAAPALPSNEVLAGHTSSRSRLGWRTVVMAVALVAYWAYILALPQLEMIMFVRFVTRMGAMAGLLLLTLALWTSNSRFRWRDRFLVLGVNVALIAAFSTITDKTMNAFGLIIGGFPWIATLGAVWLWFSAERSLAARRAGLLVLPVLVFGTLTLLRWDGLDGAQQSTYAWRWTSTSEELALRESRNVTPVSVSNPESLRDWNPQPGDWTAFRGGQCEGVVEGVPLLNWKDSTPKAEWTKRVGPAWSSLLVVDGFLVTLEQRGESEAVVCYKDDGGDPVWIHEMPGRFEEPLSGIGPRSTPTFDDGKVYVFGAKGQLTCLHAKDGRQVWTRNAIEDADATVPMWGSASSPLIVDDLVVAFAGGGPKSVMAYRAATGEPVWSSPGGKDSYSTPQLMTIDGLRQIVTHDNQGLHALNPLDGSVLWEDLHPSESFQPMLQPHAVGANDLVVQVESGVARLSVTRKDGQWSIERKWESNRLKPSFNDFFVHKGHIYGLDDGILCCLDLETGKRLWKKGRYGFGQMLLLPEHDQLLVLSEKGELVAVAASPKGHEEMGTFPAVKGKTWNHPVISHGRLYVRNGEEMACFKLAEATTERP